AAALLRQAWRDENFDSDSDEAEYLGEFGRFLRPDDHVARLDRLLWDHNEQPAKRMLPLVDAGHQALALARLALAKKDDSAPAAVDHVALALQHDAGLLYELARSRRKAGDYMGAAAILDPPPPLITRPEMMWPELEDAARRAVLRGDMSVGYRMASDHQSTE